jgi:hypothetical protein
VPWFSFHVRLITINRLLFFTHAFLHAGSTGHKFVTYATFSVRSREFSRDFGSVQKISKTKQICQNDRLGELSLFLLSRTHESQYFASSSRINVSWGRQYKTKRKRVISRPKSSNQQKWT